MMGLASQENDGEKVVSDLVLGPCEKEALFMKHMAKQLHKLDWGFLMETINVILVRDPHRLLASFHRAQGSIQPVNTHDTCLPDQVEVMKHLEAQGHPPLVLVVEDLLENPEGILRALCDKIGLDFTKDMLSWSAGGRAEDGVWAYFWYANTHKSTGFDRAIQTPIEPLPQELEPVLEECTNLFNQLKVHAIKAN